MESYPSDLLGWMNEMESDKHNLLPLNLNSLFSIGLIHLEHDILRAAIRCWDPETHVFRFNHEELCPTFEEFSAVLGVELNCEPVIPQLQCGYFKTLSTFCDINDKQARSVVSDRKIDFSVLFKCFSPGGDPADLEYRRHSRNAFMLCMISHFLFSSFSDDMLVDVVAQIRNGKSLVIIVLAETMNGLDKAHQENSLLSSGSVLVLQIRLLEKLRILTHPRKSSLTHFYHHERKVRRLFNDFEGWISLFQQLFPTNFAWWCDWYGITSSISKYGKESGVWLIGLHQCSFYVPSRIIRQFGFEQEIPNAALNLPKVTMYTPAMARSFQKAWSSRVFLQHNLGDIPIGLPNDYMLESIKRQKRRKTK